MLQRDKACLLHIVPMLQRNKVWLLHTLPMLQRIRYTPGSRTSYFLTRAGEEPGSCIYFSDACGNKYELQDNRHVF